VRHVGPSASCVNLLVASDDVCVRTVWLFLPVGLPGKLHAASVGVMSDMCS
jgi:hypothetical protein